MGAGSRSWVILPRGLSRRTVHGPGWEFIMSTTASRLAVLVFTDIVDSAGLKTRIGATAYTPLLERHNQLFESACSVFGGTILKHTGDGFLASFSAVSDAVRAGLRFQQSMRSEAWPQAMSARVGIHTGEVVVLEMAGRPDVVGVTADVTERIMSLGCGGQILLTRSAF